MGDRGGTATQPSHSRSDVNYTRWEIGGEPQHSHRIRDLMSIIPDGRSGGNRNCLALAGQPPNIIPDGRSGGNRNLTFGWRLRTYIIPDGRSGGNRNLHVGGREG